MWPQGYAINIAHGQRYLQLYQVLQIARSARCTERDAWFAALGNGEDLAGWRLRASDFAGVS
jgi:hypothetical protein